MSKKTEDGKVIHGDFDKFGIGLAISSIAQVVGVTVFFLGIPIMLALICTGNLTPFLMALVG